MMLPRMTIGNWLFWSVMLWIGVNFFWLRFVEVFLPQWLGAIIATGLAVVVFKYGPRPSGEEEED